MFLLANRGMLISHPPYLPDLMPVDFFIFPNIETTLKGKLFQDIEGIKKNFNAELSAVPLNAFNDYFVQLLKRCKKCVAVKGEFVFDHQISLYKMQ
jgi:hypothetical protein